MSPFKSLCMLAAGVGLAGLSIQAEAETLVGFTPGAVPTLVSFDSATPGSLTTIGAITGLATGHTLRNIDFRPSNGLLYGISNLGNTSAAQLYTISTSTGIATAVGGPLTLPGSASTTLSIDFNPVVDVLRVVSGNRQNYRVNANTGALIAQDTQLNTFNEMRGIAYSNNQPGATQTTLYAYDYSFDALNTIGSVNGTPNSPNSGIVSAVGPSGFTAGGTVGFDISGATGTAYVSILNTALTTIDNSEFYTLNLATGALTFAGEFNGYISDIAVRTISAVPEPGSIVLMLAGLGALGAAARRRRAR